MQRITKKIAGPKLHHWTRLTHLGRGPFWKFTLFFYPSFPLLGRFWKFRVFSCFPFFSVSWISKAPRDQLEQKGRGQKQHNWNSHWKQKRLTLSITDNQQSVAIPLHWDIHLLNIWMYNTFRYMRMRGNLTNQKVIPKRLYILSGKKWHNDPVKTAL